MTFKQRVRFFFQGRPYLKIIAVLLSAVSFAFCALASLAVTNNRMDYVARGLYNYDRLPFTTIETLGTSYSSESKLINIQNIIDIYETETNFSYAYGYSFGNTKFNVGNYFEALEYITENGIQTSTSLVVSSKWEVLEELFGYSVTAGRYPEAVTEIAISEAYYEMFKQFGYVNVYGAYEQTKHGYWYFYADDASALEVETINDYSDIIGKTIVLVGDPETGDFKEVYNSKTGKLSGYGAIYEATIVGVIKTNISSTIVKAASVPNNFYSANKIYVSEAWREKFFYKDGAWRDDKCKYMYTRSIETYQEARNFAEALLEAADLLVSYGFSDVDTATIVDTLLLLSDKQAYYLQTLLVFGVPLFVLAIVLQIFMAEYSLRNRRKQIGVLQSLGMSREQLMAVFIAEAVALSLIILLLAVPLSYGVFYEWIYPNVHVGATFDIYLLDYNVGSLLILLGMGLIIPALVTYICAKKFLKRAPIENIQNISKRKQADIRREEAKRQRDLKKLQELKDKYEKN